MIWPDSFFFLITVKMIPCTLFIFKNINLKTIEIVYLTLDKLKGTLITDWNFKEDIWYWNNRNYTEKIGLTSNEVGINRRNY
jgi:hypothetical protein